ncbi:MAG: FadR/GntR family transcriptional regulator [Candidatus Ornithomonoglobus sp.]
MGQKQSTYELLKEYIISQVHAKQLFIGSKLPTEDELSSILKVTKSSIRDALKLLSSRGIIDIRQGSGNYLQMNIGKDISESINIMLMLKQYSQEDISQLREAIDLKAFELACVYQTESDIALLKQYLYQMKNNIDLKGNDMYFHQKIIEMSKNPLLVVITEALIKNAQEYILISWENILPENKEKLMGIHFDICNCLENNDVQAGKKLISEHYTLASTMFVNNKELLLNKIKKTELSEEQLKDILEILNV